MNAVIYCRVSSKEQVQNLSLPTQEKACRDYCHRLGWNVARVFVEEGESAKTVHRTEFQKLLSYCREHKDIIRHVVVYSVSRFARDTSDHFAVRAHLHKMGISLRSVTEYFDETSSGKLMEGILASFAQYDNDVRSERTATGMKARFVKGQWTFPAPTGYKKSRTASGDISMDPDPERAPFIRRAFELFATGMYKKRDLLTKLNAQGFRTAKGIPVSGQTFDRILCNSIYAGRMIIPGWDMEGRGNFEPLVTDEVFDRVQAVLAGKRPVIQPEKRYHHDFPLRHFVRCGRCNTPLTASWCTGRGKRYPYYYCQVRECHAVNIRKEKFEAQFSDFLGTFRPERDYMKLFKAVVSDVWREKQRDAVALGRKLSRRLADLRIKQSQLDEAFIYQNRIDKTTYDAQSDRLREEIMMTEMQQRDASIEELDIDGVLSFADHVLTNAARLWDEAEVDQRQRLQRALFPKGLTYLDGGYRTAVSPLFFKDLRQISIEKPRIVAPPGLEPGLF